MAAGLFNIAKGRLVHYASLPAAADGFLFVLLSAVEADDVLNNYTSLSELLAATGNTEATFTGYTRVPSTAVTVTTDTTANTVKVDVADPSWSPTSAQALAKLLICYDADTAAGTDADIVPLFFDDVALTTNTSGTLLYNVASGGFCTST